MSPERAPRILVVDDRLAALDAATAAGSTYDLVVINNHMPHPSGQELIALYRPFSIAALPHVVREQLEG